MGGHPFARGRSWGRAPRARPCHARTSLPDLAPPFARYPADLLTGLKVDQVSGILFWQGRGPFMKASLSRVGRLWMGVTEGVPEEVTKAPFDLVPSCLL